MKTPKEVALYAVNEISAARNSSDRTLSLILTVASRAVEADRAQRNNRLVVTSADGARTAAENTVADLLQVINAYLDDGYTAEELIIEGVTQ